MRERRRTLLACAVLTSAALLPLVAGAEPGLPALAVQTGSGGGQTYSLTLQVLLLMTAVSLLPAIILMMTAFTRIVIVLGILRQAIGAGNTPPNQVLVGLAFFLTLFVMSRWSIASTRMLTSRTPPARSTGPWRSSGHWCR
jgi:flagellar biosynthetic protein FliP